MNFKKVLTLILAASFASVSVSAATFSNVNSDITTDYKSLEISGALLQNGEKNCDEVLIKVLNPGYKEDEIEAAFKSNQAPVVAVEWAEPQADGTFYKKIGLKDDLADGRYYIYLSGKNLSETKKLEMWYIKDLQPYVDDIKSQTSAEDLNKKLFLNEKKYATDPDDLTYDTADIISLKNVFYKENVCDSEISKIIFAEKDKITDWPSLKKLFKTACIIGAFETQNTSQLFGSDGLFKETVFDENDDAYLVKCEKMLKESVNADGKAAFATALSGKSYADTKDFCGEFVNAVFYQSVFNNNTDGYGHIPDLISEYSLENTFDKKQDFSSFNSLSDSNKLSASNTLFQSEAKDVSDINTVLSETAEAFDEDKDKDKDDTNAAQKPSYSGGGGGGGGGSSYAAGGGYIQKLEEESQKREEEYFETFSDMEGYDWAKTAVEYLVNSGIVSGTGENTFSPEKNITREEFAKMLVLAMGYPLSENESGFSDVDSFAWYAPYVATLEEMEIVKGTEENKFNTGSFITREEACTLLYRAAAEKLKSGEGCEFKDEKDISDYAKEAVNSLSAAKIVTGSENGEFLPKNNMTRAEAAVVFYRLLNMGGNA